MLTPRVDQDIFERDDRFWVLELTEDIGEFVLQQWGWVGKTCQTM